MTILYSSRGRVRILDQDILIKCLTSNIKFHYEIWAASVMAVVATGSAAYEFSGAGTPQQPNLASSTKELSDTEAALLPEERQLAAAAAMGGTTTNPGYTVSTSGDKLRTSLNNQISSLQNQLAQQQKENGVNVGGRIANTTGATQQIQSQITGLQSQLANIPEGSGSKVYLDKSGNVVPESQAVTDFGQYGGAQTQANIATQNAGNQLAIQQEYDPQFISEALKEEQLADPNSVAARQRESELIQQQINNPIKNPIASTLQDQISQQVSAGKGLDDFDTQALNNSVAAALKARGGASGTDADFTSPLTTGAAGNQRQLAGISAGQSFLGSGTTPQDVQYRQEQQNLANLSAEVSGQTPTSEFGGLSNASKGASPAPAAGAALPTMSDPLETAGNAALTTQQQQEGQSNNWMAGLSTVLNATGALGALSNNIGKT